MTLGSGIAQTLTVEEYRAKVLDYIGVGWDPTTIGGNCKGQMSIFDM